MSQITINLDDRLVQQLMSLASQVNLSVDKLIANLLTQRIHHGWNASTISLVGAWADDAAIDTNLSAAMQDSSRESL
jgi:predicted DNA-binding ribbon-helix-helix protein